MATPTTHYNLLKPTTGETYDVNTLDTNYDKIDAALWGLDASSLAANIKVTDGSTAFGNSTGLAANIANHSVKPIIQAGSVVVSPDANGYGNFAWPQAFPNGVITCVITNGDDLATGKNVVMTLGSASINATACYVNAVVTNTGAGYTNAFRLNYIAIGW